MSKKKVGLGYRILHGFTYHPWLKIIALILAVIVWFYAGDQVSKFGN
jgi:hypothetical protein